MKRRMLSILCVLALVVAMLSPITASAAALSTPTVGGANALNGSCWLTNADTGTLTSEGATATLTVYAAPAQSNGVYQIGTADELFWFAGLVNGTLTDGTAQDTAASAVLTADITIPNDGSGTYNWAPIGSYSIPYTGTFDGAGYTIDYLVVNNQEGYAQGFVGHLSSGGEIRDLTLGGNCSISGNTYVGGICGSSTSSEDVITNCANQGKVTGSAEVGGICSYNLGNITNCYSTGTVSASNYVGAVCGSDSGTITNCYWLENTATTGIGDSTYGGEAISKNAGDFASGQVCWLLNGSTSEGSLAWYQNLDNGQTKDDYPVLDSTHGTVYCIDEAYSNNPDATAEPTDITGATVTLSPESFTYNGSAQKPNVTVTLNGKTLTENTHYTMTYSGDSTNVGTVTVTVEGKGNYSGKATASYTIEKATPTLTWGGTSQTMGYTGNPAAITAPTVTLVNGESYSGTISYQYKAEGTDTYADGLPTNAGTYTVVASIVAQGNYTEATSGELTLTIEKAAASGTASAVTGLTYTGEPQALVTAGTVTGGTMQYSTEETGTYSAEIPTGTNADTYTVWYKVVGDSDHSDTDPVEVEVTIYPAEISITGATLTAKTYDGTKAATVIGVTFGGVPNSQSLTLGDDYTATAEFTDANAGTDKTATVTVTLNNGNYTLAESTYNLTGQTIAKADQVAPIVVTGSYAVSSTNSNQFVYTVTAISGAEYKMDSGSWQDSNSFDGIEPESSHTFYARLKEDENHNASPEGSTGAVIFSKLANTNKPTLDYTVSGDQGNRIITITPVEGAEYSFDGTNWSDVNTKTYTDDVTVTVYIRYKETATLLPSDAVSTEVNTAKADQAAPAEFTLGFTWNDDGVTLTATIPMVEGAEYSFDGATWSDVNTKTDCQPNTQYTGYIRMKETETHNASPTTSSTATSPELKPETYTVTLSDAGTGATGGGQYKAGDTVTVTAGSKTGYTFKAWTATGVELSDPTSAKLTFTMPKENVTLTASWTANQSTGGGSTGGGSTGGGSSSSDNKTETTTNPDGSTTTTVTSSDGTVTETTKFPDGSKEVVETKKDGTVTTTTTDTAGNKTEVVENTDGSSKTTVDNKDGSGSVTVVDENGQVVSEATLSQSTVAAAQEKGEAVGLPIPEVPVTTDRETAPTVTVNLPGGTTAKVEIPVAGVTPGTVAVIVKADGTEEVIKTSLTTENGVAVTLSDGDTVKIVDNSKTFDDVADNYWGAEAVAFVTSRELFTGTSATTFAPDVTTSRAMIATILWRMAGSPVVDYAMTYTDVAQGQWYSEAVRWATSEGVVTGYSNGLFGTNDPITREQLVAMLWRYAQTEGYDVSVGGDTNILSYTDAADLSEYAIPAMQWACGAGIINGTGDGSTLTPQGQATRAQAAVMLMRFYGYYA